MGARRCRAWPARIGSVSRVGGERRARGAGTAPAARGRLSSRDAAAQGSRRRRWAAAAPRGRARSRPPSRVAAVTAAVDQSLRGFLDVLERRGELRRIEEPVAARFELSALLAAADAGGPALRFERVGESGMEVVGGVLATRERIAAGLGVEEFAAVQERLLAALARPLAVRELSDAPCQQLVRERPDLGALPIPWFFEHETGPYVTAGAIVARDGADGPANLSIARLKPLGGARALAGIAPNHHLAVLARRAAARGETLPIAVAVGNHPAVLLAACLYLDLGVDELTVAGALLGEQVEVARTAAGLLVPAHCELVLEGRLDAGELVEEGLVSEFHGMYEDYGRGGVVTFERLTSRREPLFQVVEPGRHGEHVLLGAV